jgi:hypothetical protein
MRGECAGKLLQDARHKVSPLAQLGDGPSTDAATVDARGNERRLDAVLSKVCYARPVSALHEGRYDGDERAGGKREGGLGVRES